MANGAFLSGARTVQETFRSCIGSAPPAPSVSDSLPAGVYAGGYSVHDLKSGVKERNRRIMIELESPQGEGGDGGTVGVTTLKPRNGRSSIHSSKYYR